MLAIGGIEHRKGSVALLEGFACLRRELPARDPLLVVAGGATLFDHRDEIGRFAGRREELGLDDRVVRLLGPVADERVERLYRAADVFAFPSVVEGFGLVVLEAMASALPVVTTDLDVLRDVALHERSALVAPAGDADAFGRELCRAAQDDALRARLRAGAPRGGRPLRLGRRGPGARARLRRPAGPDGGRPSLMAERLEVRATFRGPWATDVGARGHEIRIDEPASANGDDTGMMPTEAFLASLAACFAMAVAFAGRKRDLEVPGLEVVVTAERAGKELRYGRLRSRRAPSSTRRRWPSWSSARGRSAGYRTRWPRAWTWSILTLH